MSDITMYLSGGSSNVNPNLSLGGEISTTTVSSIAKNNLFADVSSSHAKQGEIVYRCIYVKNTNVGTTWNMNAYLSDDVPEGSLISIGTTFKTEVQRIGVNGTATGGYFNVSYLDETPISVSWSASVATWANNLQTALNSIPGLQDIIVVGSQVSGYTDFRIEFSGDGNNKYYSILVCDNHLTGATSISVNKIFDGSPINSIAQSLPNETSSPSEVEFIYPTVDSPLSIGNVMPNDYFPVWIKRTTPVNTTSIQDDGFTLRISGG